MMSMNRYLWMKLCENAHKRAKSASELVIHALWIAKFAQKSVAVALRIAKIVQPVVKDAQRIVRTA